MDNLQGVLDPRTLKPLDELGNTFRDDSVIFRRGILCYEHRSFVRSLPFDAFLNLFGFFWGRISSVYSSTF